MENDLNRTKENAKITLEELSNLLCDYQIGKKPLAKLLGWGETTILRYLEGEIPTGEYAEKLYQLKKEPKQYYSLLMANQDNITGVAFRKSKKAILLKLFERKIDLAAQYLVNKADADITPKQVQYILFYSQAMSLSFVGKSLFQEECRMTKDKIPYEKLYLSMRSQECKYVELPEIGLTKEDERILNIVSETMDWYGSKAVKLMIESDCSRLNMRSIEKTDQLLAKPLLQRYFRKMFEQYQCASPEGFIHYMNKRITLLLKEKYGYTT